MDLFSLAKSLEWEAIQLKKERKYDEAVKKFSEASIEFEKSGNQKESDLALANSCWILGNAESIIENFVNARTHLNKAETIFKKYNLIRPAFFVAIDYSKTYQFQRKVENIYLDELEEFLEYLLEEYNLYNCEEPYIEKQLEYYKLKSSKENKEEWLEKCVKLAKTANIEYNLENYKELSLHFERRLGLVIARRLRREKKYSEAIECYQLINKISEDNHLIDQLYFGSMGNFHYLLAMENDKNRELCLTNIQLAIECIEKTDDVLTKNYYYCTKIDLTLHFLQDVDSRIKFLEDEKKDLMQRHEIPIGKYAEYLLFYWLAQKRYEDSKFNEAIVYIDKAIKISHQIQSSNIITLSRWYPNDLFLTKQILYKSFLEISKGNFSGSIPLIDEYINKYQKMYPIFLKSRAGVQLLIIRETCKVLSQKKFDREDLTEIEKMVMEVQGDIKKSQKHIQILELVQSYVILTLNKLPNKLLEEIKIRIVGEITNWNLSEEFEDQIAANEIKDINEWISQLPQSLVTKFDQCHFLLHDMQDELMQITYKEFYLLLENFLRPIVEYNSYKLWNEEWKIKLPESISSKKTFEKFTFGDLIQSLLILRQSNVDILNQKKTDSAIKLLQKHLVFRNDLSHEIENQFVEKSYYDEVLKIMYSLLDAFPVCLKITNKRKKPWYDIEILWSRLPKKVTMKYEEIIDETNFFYTSNDFKIEKNVIYPNQLVPVCEENLVIFK